MRNMKFYEFKFRMFHILTSHLSPLTTKEAELAKVDLSYELFCCFLQLTYIFMVSWCGAVGCRGVGEFTLIHIIHKQKRI